LFVVEWRLSPEFLYTCKDRAILNGLEIRKRR